MNFFYSGLHIQQRTPQMPSPSIFIAKVDGFDCEKLKNQGIVKNQEREKPLQFNKNQYSQNQSNQKGLGIERDNRFDDINLNRNTKEKKPKCQSMIVVREFIKSLRKDRIQTSLVEFIFSRKVSLKALKSFIQNKIPDEGKYIKKKAFEELYDDPENKLMSEVFRIVFLNYLNSESLISSIGKEKKKRKQYLMNRRQILEFLSTIQRRPRIKSK